jgi:hypothetical protein
MTPLEQEERQLKHPSLSTLECEFLSAFWHWAGRAEPILIIIIAGIIIIIAGILDIIIAGILDGFPTNHYPSPAAGACDASARNAIHDSEIIR